MLVALGVSVGKNNERNECNNLQSIKYAMDISFPRFIYGGIYLGVARWILL